jgi:hypothetical protein
MKPNSNVPQFDSSPAVTCPRSIRACAALCDQTRRRSPVHVQPIKPRLPPYHWLRHHRLYITLSPSLTSLFADFPLTFHRLSPHSSPFSPLLLFRQVSSRLCGTMTVPLAWDQRTGVNADCSPATPCINVQVIKSVTVTQLLNIPSRSHLQLLNPAPLTAIQVPRYLLQPYQISQLPIPPNWHKQPPAVSSRQNSDCHRQ